MAIRNLAKDPSEGYSLGMTITIAEELFDEICKIPCINSHSHLLTEDVRLSMDVDALMLFQHSYQKSDLITAGMPPVDREGALNPGLPLAERWRLFEPYWKAIQLTGYSECIIEFFRDLCGFDELTGNTVGAISDAMRQWIKPGCYEQILRHRCNIAISVMNMEDLVEVDRKLFVPLPRLNRFSSIRSRNQILALEKDYNVAITSLEDLVEAISNTCEQWKRAMAAGVKLSQSYYRRMDFEERDADDATKVFAALLEGSYAGLQSQEGRLLEDYLVFECCRIASDLDLAIQFHMGMRGGNCQSLEGASPAPMVNLLNALPNARFDFSHCGFPYLREAAVLAKTFANVYLNMSWIHIISPVAVRRAFKEWLRMVPYTKIIGFGDNVEFVEIVYGHLKIARRNVASVLAAMIEEGTITESTAGYVSSFVEQL